MQPLYGWIIFIYIKTFHLSIQLLIYILGVSTFPLLWIGLLWTFVYKFWFEHLLSTFWGLSVLMKFLGHMAILCLTYWVTSSPFSPPPALVCGVSSVPQREHCVALPTAQPFITPLGRKVRRGPRVSSLKQKAVSQRLLFFFFFFKNFFFWCGPFLKSLLNLLQYCFCLMFWFFGREACGMLAPQPELNPSFALEGEGLTSGLPGKPPPKGFLCLIFTNQMSPMCPP